MSSRISEIDGLRAVALSGVLLYHARLGNFLPGGFVGVDIFFVISGYVVTLSILKQIHLNKFSLSNFLLRRITRLIPALVVTLILTNLIVQGTFTENHRKSAGVLALAATFSFSNIVLWLQSNYFDTNSRLKPFLHTWSLSVEWQFYLTWAVLSFFISKKVPSLRWQLLLLLGMALISLMFSIVALEKYPSGVFYNLIFRHFEFACGCIPAWYKSCTEKVSIHDISSETKKNDRTKSAASNVMTTAASMVIVIYFAFFRDSYSFPGINVLPLCLSSAIIILKAHSTFFGVILRNPFVLWLGEISYSVYLVHWPMLVLLDYELHSKSTALQRLVVMTLSIPLGHVMSISIEKPFYAKNFTRFNLSEKVKKLAISFMMFTALIQSITMITYSRVHHADPENELISVFKKSSKLQIKRKNENRGHYGLLCHLSGDYPRPTNFEKCNPKRSKEIVLFGDSHAQDFYAALNSTFWPDSGTIQMTAAGFSFTDEIQSGQSEHCQVMYDSYRDLLSNRYDSIKAAIIASRWKPYIETEDIRKLNDTIFFFNKELGVPIWVFGPRPEFAVAPLRLIETNLKKKISKEELKDLFQNNLRLKESTDQFLRRVVVAQNASYVSLTNELCNLNNDSSRTCSIFSENQDYIYYTDRHHINFNGAIKLLQPLIPELKMLLKNSVLSKNVTIS